MSSINTGTNVKVRFRNASDTNETADIETRTTGDVQASSSSRSPITVTEPEQLGLTKILKSIYDHVNQIRDRMQIEAYKQCSSNEWLLVAILVDKIFFFIYCFNVVIVTTNIFKK